RGIDRDRAGSWPYRQVSSGGGHRDCQYCQRGCACTQSHSHKVLPTSHLGFGKPDCPDLQKNGSKVKSSYISARNEYGVVILPLTARVKWANRRPRRRVLRGQVLENL